ncbi:hypothetical protein MMC30_001756 [Trapelia coarctata]|nr:hypothetical protein [Trapelia coarctata]
MVNQQPEGGGGRDRGPLPGGTEEAGAVEDTSQDGFLSPIESDLRKIIQPGLDAQARLPPADLQSHGGGVFMSGFLPNDTLTADHLSNRQSHIPTGLDNHHNALQAVLAASQAGIVPEEHGIPPTGGDGFAQNGEVLQLDEAPLPSIPLHPSQSSVTDIAFLDSAASVPDSECPRIQAFAKLEFDDGQFYMNTYSVELGRDIRAAKAAFHNRVDAGHEQASHRHKRSNSSADAYQTPRRPKHSGSRNLENNVVSETGGIIGVDAVESERKKKLRRNKTKSTSSSSHYPSRKNSMHVSGPQTDYQSLAMASLTDPQSIDAMTFLPSPEECPLIPIHPPAVTEGSNTGHRGISRRHVKIAYNFEKRLFELEVIGKNGAFMDEQYYAPGEVQELRSGSYIQIGGVGVRFVLPDVAIGETGAEGLVGPESVIESAMSFDFEDGRGESITMADSPEPTTSDEDTLGISRKMLAERNRNHRIIMNLPPAEEEEDDEDEEEDGDEDEEDEEEEEEEQEEGEVEEQVEVQKKRQVLRLTKPAKPPKGASGKGTGGKNKPKVEPIPEPPVQPPKRKGPGRPPKNGIISKREQALLARQAREAAKAEALKNGLIKPGKSAKPDNQNTETTSQPDAKPEKRKYTKRKKPEDLMGEQDRVRETTEKTDSIPPEQTLQAQPPKPAKEKRPPKPPRSPSPVFDEATLTPEQLAKPSQSYVVLIHEALTNSKTGAMSLPQIYRAIERRYPYYKLRVTTTGWQSSVRHNLSQHAAFRKIERDGKGWMWGLVPEISIEKEKKRRPTPPPMPPHQYYQHGPHMYRHPYPYPGMPPPPNGHLPPPNGYPPYAMHPGMPPPPGYPPHPAGIPRGTNGIPLPLAPQQNASSTYQSPYQAPPPSQQPEISQQPEAQSQQPPASDQGASAGTPSAASNQPPPPPPSLPQNPQAHQPPNPSPAPPDTSQSASATPAPNNPSSMDQPILAMVGLFKKNLIASLEDRPYAEEMVTQAINRTLGIAPPPGAVIKEYPEEVEIMKALAKMLQTTIGQRGQSVPAAAQTPVPAPAKSTSPAEVGILVEGSPAPVTPFEPSVSASATDIEIVKEPAQPLLTKNEQSAPAPLPQNVQPPSQLMQLLLQMNAKATTDPPLAQQAEKSKSKSPVPAARAADGILKYNKPPPEAVISKESEGVGMVNGIGGKGLKRGLEEDSSSGEAGIGMGRPQMKRIAS